MEHRQQGRERSYGLAVIFVKQDDRAGMKAIPDVLDDLRPVGAARV
jgi:hypothetical protein